MLNDVLLLYIFSVDVGFLRTYAVGGHVPVVYKPGNKGADNRKYTLKPVMIL